MNEIHEMLLFGGTVFMGFFAIMNPFANTPIFLGLTSEIDDRKLVVKIAFHSVLYAFIIVGAFTVLGHYIYQMFGITLSAFKIGGGLLLFSVGSNLLQGKESQVHHPTPEHRKTLKEKLAENNNYLKMAISPLAIPILGGPGTISTAMNFVGYNVSLDPWEKMIVVLVIFALSCTVTFLMFVSGKKLVAYLGHSIIGVITRIMGLILVIISVQMIIGGIKLAFNL